MRISAVFIGLPQTVRRGGAEVYSAGAKADVLSAFLRFEGFEGDGQANLEYHGGKDRTVCVYPAEHYAWWRSERGHDLAYGAFSENLTVEGAFENDICVGDVFRAGGALVQVTQPRDPCRTIDGLTGIKGLWTEARGAGRCGFHMRTLEEGLIGRGDTLALVRRHREGFTIARALDLYHGRSPDRDLARRLSGIPQFAEQGRRILAERLGL